MAAESPRTTPLTDTCRTLGGRMVDFAGWLLPMQFTSVLEEHQAVRTGAGLFDVSHMGEIEVRGPGALALVQRLTCNDAGRLAPGRAQYSVLTNDQGGFVDDIIVYRRGPEEFLLVVNASNTTKDFEWIRGHAGHGATVTDVSDRWALLALQGPRAAEVLADLTPAPLDRLRPFEFADATVGGSPCIVARTGYTGEDGFEIFCPPAAAGDLFSGLFGTGRSRGLHPCGLGARDTLRLEAGMRLYGNDMDGTTTVLEAGLDPIVRFEKGEFIGSEALRRQRDAGPARRLAGFEMIEPGIARHGYRVMIDGAPAGTVTSGGPGPTVKKNIGLTYLPAARAQAGSTFAVEIRGREARARVVPIPFYRRFR
jgi:aminomethyltransferase